MLLDAQIVPGAKLRNFPSERLTKALPAGLLPGLGSEVDRAGPAFDYLFIGGKQLRQTVHGRLHFARIAGAHERIMVGGYRPDHALGGQFSQPVPRKGGDEKCQNVEFGVARLPNSLVLRKRASAICAEGR